MKKEDRKTYYSGKKKVHTLKNNVITQRGGKVLFLSDTYEGKKHDKKIADEEGYQFPDGSSLDHYADDVMETACGLHNFRVAHCQKKVASRQKVA
jgi:DDE superfamily endonuclease